MRRSQKGQKGESGGGQEGSPWEDRSRVTRRMRRVTSIGQDGSRDEGTIRVTWRAEGESRGRQEESTDRLSHLTVYKSPLWPKPVMHNKILAQCKGSRPNLTVGPSWEEELIPQEKSNHQRNTGLKMRGPKGKSFSCVPRRLFVTALQ